MSVAELKKLVPPPARPLGVGSPARWGEVEAKLGGNLPRDYRAFVSAYGTGLFADFCRVYTPFTRIKFMAQLSQGKRVCDGNRCSRRSNPERFPYPYHPEPGGLLPWGNDTNGNDYFWLTVGPPAKWVVVQDENRGDGIRVQPYSMTGFLAAVLRGEVKPLAGGYPGEDDFRFEPWGPTAAGK